MTKHAEGGVTPLGRDDPMTKPPKHAMRPSALAAVNDNARDCWFIELRRASLSMRRERAKLLRFVHRNQPGAIRSLLSAYDAPCPPHMQAWLDSRMAMRFPFSNPTANPTA